MAVIYKAQDVELGRTVAIKILRPSLTGDPSFLTRFKQEARNVANLVHPNIVTLYDFGRDGSTYYMVMEYIEGQDLKRLIRASAPFTVDRALHIAIQLCAGVGYAHRAGLVHADVKPQNILITADDQVKVTDFGIAQALSLTQPEEKQSVVWGSPHYFAPEQASGETPTPASDVYSIGIVMFEMLTGKLPYSGADQQELALAHIREQVPHVMDLNPSVPVHLDRIIYKVMSKEPSARYRTADQLGRILISYQKQGQDVTANVPYLGPTPNQSAGQAPSVPAPASPVRPAMFSGNQPAPHAQPTVGPRSNAYGNTPPPQAPYIPPRQGTGQLNRVGTGSMPAANPPNNPFSKSGPYIPPRSNTGPYALDNSGPRNSPVYQAPPPPAPIDGISIVLAIIALLAVVGLIALWLFVWNAWMGAAH